MREDIYNILKDEISCQVCPVGKANCPVSSKRFTKSFFDLKACQQERIALLCQSNVDQAYAAGYNTGYKAGYNEALEK